MRLTREQKEKILELDDLGLSVRQIESVTKIPKSTVHDLISGKTHSEFLPKKVRCKRVLAIGDLHCGHAVGLTPPDRWYAETEAYGKDYYEYSQMQRAVWRWFEEAIKEIGHVDVLIVNGDAIDGKGKRSGGTELITSDLLDQSRIAIQCLNKISFDKCFMTHGTPYHTSGDGEDFESVIAEQLGGTVEDHLFLDIDGVVFDVKHKVGGSSVPHARSTAVNKEKLWNTMWAERNAQPKCNVLLRSHVHYFQYSGGAEHVNMTLPALQAPKTKFGGRQCSGTVDVGMVVFDIYEDGSFDHFSMIMPLDFAKPTLHTV